jgi:hypothetical protein
LIDTLTIDALQIHNTYLPGNGGYFLTDAQGIWGSPPTRQDTFTKARRHGIINRTRYYDARPIELSGVVAGVSPADFAAKMDALMAILALGTNHTMFFTRSGAAPEQCTVTVSTEVVVKVANPVLVQQWACTFLADDPRMYSQLLNSLSYDPTVVGGSTGLLFPLVFPINFGGTGFNDLVIANAGTYPSPPVFTIFGPVVNPIIDNDTTNQHIVTQGCSLQQGDTLVIDVGQRSVSLGSASWLSLVLNAGPKLFWRLNEATGATTAQDLSANGHDGTYGAGIVLGQPSALVSDPNDTSASFSNTATSIVTSTYQPFVAASKRTFVGWAWRNVLTDIDTLFSSTQQLAWLTAGSGQFNWQNATGVSVNWAGAWPGAAQWVFWVLTYDDATKTAELFINGTSLGTKVFGTGYGANGNFSASQGTAPNAWNGYLDEMAVFEFILTPAQILAMYNAAQATAATIARPDFIDQTQTNWFELQPGNTLIRMRAASGMVTGQTALQAQWRNARI